jgi:tRNA(adenine34) deaminase
MPNVQSRYNVERSSTFRIEGHLANDQRPTANDLLANDQRPTTTDALAPADHRRLTTADHSDELFMQEALRDAQRALEMGEVPVGAVVICDGNILAHGWNRNLTGNDPTAHAEIVALREAGAIVGNHRLGDCELFATIEPCAMCAGALVHARIKRLVYGADDRKAGAVHSVMQVLNHPQLNHRTEVKGGVLAGQCAEFLQSFFRAKRESRIVIETASIGGFTTS